MSGIHNPDHAKRLSSNYPLGVTPDNVLMADVADTLLQRGDEHIPAFKELISLAQACMILTPSERPAFGCHGEAEGTIVRRLSLLEGALSAQPAVSDGHLNTSVTS